MFVDTFLTTDFNWNMDELVQPTMNITSVTVDNCIVDALHAEAADEPDYEAWTNTVPNEWLWTTLINAHFNGTLSAGSLEASVEQTSEIRIKRREKGTFRWQTLYVQPINTVEDFSFDWYDKTAASNTVYEYAHVPVINGVEGILSYSEIDSEFSDYFLIGRDSYYHIIVDSANQVTYNQETSSQTTVGRKYPLVVKNGNVGYYSGTLEGVVVELENCEFDYEDGEKFKRKFDQFLTNGETKLLKDWLGNIWIVFIVDSISRSNGDHYYLPSHSINWIETADATDIGDLYDNGFIDTDLDR